MSEKKTKSRAEKAVSHAKKTSESSGGSKSSGKKSTSGKKKTVPEKQGSPIPSSFLIATVSLGLFILFVAMCINPEGVVLMLVKNILLGLFGQAGFYFAIPAALYLFIIHTFCRRSAVTMRSICVVVSVLLCGCIFHLAVQTQGTATGFALLPDLYRGGIDGISGGVICGLIAMGVRLALGNFLAYVLLILAFILTLLGSMQITIPSIVRAIANRPREDEEEEEQEYVEPAAVVVNKIANHNIEQRRLRRQRLEAMEEEVRDLPQSTPQQVAKRGKRSAPVQQAAIPEPVTEVETTTGTPSRAAGVMSTIDLDISAPVFGEPPKQKAAAKKEETASSSRMPVLNLDEEPAAAPKQESAPKPLPKAVTEPVEEPSKPVKKEKPNHQEAQEAARQVAEEIEKGQNVQQVMYAYPPLSLLKLPPKGSADGTDEMRENSRRLNETLASFRIDARIINVTRGPSVTRYEVELDKGVRLNKLTGCADDIALSLGASGVRIAAVPGKISIVGIEVPNRSVTTVSLRDVIGSPEFGKAKSRTSFAVGKDIGGSCIVGNIAKMPHMLIAGTTGSGKSVCMNSIIISLLYKASPEDVKLIMVDPKMVELGIYNGIPHLLIPVVTDPKKAAGSLQWAVTEMMRRYKMMSDLGVRDLESYNSIVETEEDGKKLPSVVVIIDELADLMMVAAKEVEESICRIAQMGRAAGMHLIIATQRPSADVITGLMKANIPSRIAFSVASAMESRIILDTQGAEKLVGKGDMLYSPIGSGKPLRVQGCFVTDMEVEAVASFVKENCVADYDQNVLAEIDKNAQQAGKKSGAAGVDPMPNSEELEGDEMLPAAVDVILETKQASVSMLQRRLKLGYARAARIVDEMEEKGIVGPFQGSKPRAILITKEEWEARKNGVQMSMDDMVSEPVPEEIL